MKKFNIKNSYVKAGLTAFCVVAACILFYFGLSFLGKFFKTVGWVLSILAPCVWGLGLAYILAPVTGLYERRLFKPMVENMYRRHPKLNKGRKLARGLAVMLAVITLLLILSAMFYLIVPQMYESVKALVEVGPDYINHAYESIDKLFDNNPETEQMVTNVFGNVTTSISGWISNKVLPGMENAVSDITTGIFSALKTLYNFIIGLVFAIYILGNKENFIAYCKKLIYSMLSTKSAEKLGNVLKFMDKTFMDFIVGNSIDAVIIGVACYVFCLIFRMPYALLIAVIVGVTNFIPFFGPFIGAIPSALLILMVDPLKCLIFIIFCVVIQQLDSTYIKPKIFGDAFGINGFWVMFAIIFFGGLFGFWGMLLGVPVFVLLYEGISRLINRSLENKELPTDAGEYMDLDYIDPETGEMVRKKKADDIPPEKPGATELNIDENKK